MLVGIVGAPNKGKSTLFSALTLNQVEIADYPFTTINPNLGVAYVTRECVEKSLSVKCNARNSLCVGGIRYVPVNMIDVAGLVEDAHLGKGMGNQFLNDLANASALIMVVDASGKTDAKGNPCDNCDPTLEVKMVNNELVEWLFGIIKRHINSIAKESDGVEALTNVLNGLRVSREQVRAAIDASFLPSTNINWPDEDIRTFSSALLKLNKPTIIAANKSDKLSSDENIALLKKEFGDKNVVECSAAVELALRRAAKQNIIDYVPGLRSFNITREGLSRDQTEAVNYMLEFVKSKNTNVQNIIDRVVFELLDNIIIYPVEDENKYTDHFGNVLPDAVLIKRGSTAFDLAETVHTDIAKNMLYAIDARSKRRLAKDYTLKDNDVIKIVSAAK